MTQERVLTLEYKYSSCYIFLLENNWPIQAFFCYICMLMVDPWHSPRSLTENKNLQIV